MSHRIEMEALLAQADWLRRLAASLVRDPAGADDLVQDTWVAALRRPPEAEPRAWLARVAGNLARNARRASARRATHEGLAHEERTSATPADALAEAEAQRLLAEAVTRLPEDLRVVVVLRYFRGLDSSAIGRELALSPSAVRTRLQRALEALRVELDGRFGGDRRAWAALLARLAPGSASVAAGAGVGIAGATFAALGLGAAAILVVTALRGGFASGEQAEVEASLRGAVVEPVSTSGGLADELLTATRSPERSSAEPTTAVASSSLLVDPAATVELAGRILVDGTPAEWPMELWIAPPSEGARDAWQAQLGDLPQHIVTTKEHPDRFRFGAVPAGWTGSLRVEHATFANGTDTLALEKPSSDLVLQLLSGPALVGRFLDTAGEPLGRTRFVYHVENQDGGCGGALETDRAGRFRVPLRAWAGTETAVAALLLEADDRGYLRYQAPVISLWLGHDAGDLRVEPVRTLRFRVRDPDGKPLAGAIARVEGPSWARRCEPTDERGEGILRFAPERAVELRVSALRHADRVLAIEPLATPEVVLERLASLEVQLVSSPSTREARGRLVVSATQPFYGEVADERETQQELQIELGATQPLERSSGSGPGSINNAVYGPRADDRYLLVGLRPGVPIDVELRDPAGKPLALRSLTLAAGEWARLEIPLGP